VIKWSTIIQPTPEQVDALLAAITVGLALFSIHAGTATLATFWSSAPYLTMLGSRFLRHDPYKEFTVEISTESHPITQGVENL